MKPLFIEGGYLGVFIIVLLIMFLPPVIMLIVGLAIKPKKKKTAKVLFITSALYLLIGLGVCGSLYI